jgi:hypothetical protein
MRDLLLLVLAPALLSATIHERKPTHMKDLKEFLVRAHHSTYANIHAPKALPLRPDSKDYHFEEGDFCYHDTFFGGKQFLGEEVVYWKGKPFWGMNYYGRGLPVDLPESYFDEILRPALMEEPSARLPVRGPEYFVRVPYEYSFTLIEGDIRSFVAEEKIALNGEIIFITFLHGGIIE